MDTTWLEGPSPGWEAEQATLQPVPPPAFSSSLLPGPPAYPPPALTLGRGWWWAGWSLEGVGSLGEGVGGGCGCHFPNPRVIRGHQ